MLAQVPVYSNGLNGGVILMNITKIARMEVPWVQTNLDIYDKYQQYINLADQDILNVFFNQVLYHHC